MKVKEKELARKLRKEQGLSLNEIVEKVDAAKSSISLWVRDIELNEEQKARLIERDKGFALHPDAQFRNSWRLQNWINIHRNKRISYQRLGREQVKNCSDLYKMGCMLYWAEGTKNRNAIKFTNSDPHMMKLFQSFLDKEFYIPKEKYTIAIHVYLSNNKTLEEIQNYWLTLLDLDRDNLRKCQVNNIPSSSKQYKKNKLIYGVCHLAICDTSVIQQIYGSIKEIAGIDDEELWLY